MGSHFAKPSVWGWNTKDMFCWTPSLVHSALAKWDVNHGSRSEIIFDGNPNHQ